MAKSDQKKGLRGTRKWWWSKDTNIPTRNDVKADTDIEFACDVDYYVDMPDLLSSRAKPTLLYTLVPEEAAGLACDNASFTFDEDGAIDMVVSGAGRYQHFIWDYGTDSLIVTRKCWFWPTSVITYAVESRQIAKHRKVVLLSPVLQFQGLAALLAHYLLQGKHLERFIPIVRNSSGEAFVRFKVHTSCETKITTARPGNLLCATVAADDDEAIGMAERINPTTLQLGTARSWLPDKWPRKQALVLTEYHRLFGPQKLLYVFPVDQSVRAYSYEPRCYDQSEKPKMEAFMSPLVHEAFAPVINAASERRCVEGRINSLKKPEPKTCEFTNRCIREFAKEIVGDVDLEPFGVEEVEKKQTRPQQKLSLARAHVSGPTLMQIMKCFIKGEAYQGVKDPRNISTYNDSDKLEMSQYALALSEHLKQFAWYAPGKTPVEIAKRVAEICSDAEMVNVSDYHRMDGTISYLLRNVDRGVFMRAFKHHKHALNELLKRNVDNIGVLPLGTTFEQGSSHGSGCPATSVSQTLRAAFTAYLGFRHTKRRGSTDLYSHEQAFAALGIHLGDDGLDADLPIASHDWAARKVGLKLEASTVSRGDRGVNFLARYYSPEVWTGCADSMCDVARQLSKFHVSLRLPAGVTAEAKLVEKAMGFVATDANTPVIGQLCAKAVALGGTKRTKHKLGIASWWSQYDDDVQYPNENSLGWMDEEFSIMLPQFDRELFDGWLSSSRTIGSLLQAPLCVEPKPARPGPVPVVVDHDVLPAAGTPPTGGTEPPAAADVVAPAEPPTEAQPVKQDPPGPAADVKDEGWQVVAKKKRQRKPKTETGKPTSTPAGNAAGGSAKPLAKPDKTGAKPNAPAGNAAGKRAQAPPARAKSQGATNPVEPKGGTPSRPPPKATMQWKPKVKAT